jgi:hypothetical protein
MTNNQDIVEGGRVKKVAVIAVHGISDQKPYESARAIADLLLTNADLDQSTYAPFEERFIRVKVAPVKLQEAKNIEVSQNWNQSIFETLGRLLPQKWIEILFELWYSVDERGPHMQKLLTGKSKIEHDPFTEPDYLFIRDQIEAYKTQTVYDSICLKGQCTFTEPHTQTTTQVQVHVYEMYWADLSRLGSGFIRIFGEFYQLLFHLGSLGRQSVDLMRAEHQEISSQKKFRDLLSIWAWYSATQALAGRILSLFLPILHLCLLVVALMSLPGNIPESYAGSVAAISTGLLLTIAVGYGFLHRDKPAFWRWLLLPFGFGLVAALGIEAFVTGAFKTGIAFSSYRWLALEWVALLSVAIWFILVNPYSRHRPGADTFAIAIGFPLGLMTVGFLCLATDSHEGITQASFHMIEVIFLLLLLGWLVFLLLYFSTLVIAGLAIARIPKSPSSGQTLARQAAWTARFALALPALLFSLLTLSLWVALASLSEHQHLLPQGAIYKPLRFFKNVPPFFFTPDDFANRLTVFSGSPLAVFIILAVVLALGLLLWVLVPSILTEKFPPKNQDPKKLFSQGLGNWLNNGLRLILGPGDWIISWVIPFLFLVGTIDGISLLAGNKESFLIHHFGYMKDIFDSTKILLAWVAGLLTASVTGLIAFGSRLDQLSLVLDVDNYLRLHPRDDNPSARIYARYTSLLRYLCRQTTLDGKPYDAFIIVAHSQGTVISADLLRFLAIEPDPELAQIAASNNVYLFTMGSPIRQLYSYAFPHLYRWAIHTHSSAETSLALSSQANPSPKLLLGIRTWVNAFRSGDYVGRYLWRSDRFTEQWIKANFQEPPTHTAVCSFMRDSNSSVQTSFANA